MVNRTNRTQFAAADATTGTTAIDPLNAAIGTQDTSAVLGGVHDQTLEELRDSLNAIVATDSNDPAFRKFTGDSKFMEEDVIVTVSTSTDPNAEPIVTVYNNGTPQHFPRGVAVICKRKYVEVLARAKPFNVSTPEITDSNGDRTTKIVKNTGLRYPFDMRDRNPNGQAWLSSVIQEA